MSNTSSDTPLNTDAHIIDIDELLRNPDCANSNLLYIYGTTTDKIIKDKIRPYLDCYFVGPSHP